MTTAARLGRTITATNRPLRSPPRARVAVSPETRHDIQCCAVLLVLTAIMLLPGSLSLPMELWDESRDANNAMEIARHGGWMVTEFGGVPDHWNTKPPLLIWIIAALLRTGMDPMLAVRLPSVAATMGSVLLVYFTCRGLPHDRLAHDRLAGMIGGLLVICSPLFMGDHVGRTGDYDALLAFLCLAFVVCAGRYIDAEPDRSAGWIGASGVLLWLAIMTKGVAAGLAVPGLLAYAIARRRFVAILRDWHFWASTVGVIAGVAGWLATRERLDPGYLAAAWHNDVAGRLLTALEQHAEGPLFYPWTLAMSFEPAILLLPTLLVPRRDPDPARRRLCLVMSLAAASWLIVLSCASTKVYWYVAPVVPLLAIAIAAATTAFLRRPERPTLSRVVIRLIIVTLLIMSWYVNFWYLNMRAPDTSGAYAADQVWYGPFLAKARAQAELNNAVIVDRGLLNDAGFEHYNPVARFFVEDAARRGEHLQLIAPGEPLAGDATIISCDPQVRDWLRARSFFAVLLSDTHCILGRAALPSDHVTTPED
jgi:4-amino-4-deoxy-L-arabinose transferase-like glycosyltransferase